MQQDEFDGYYNITFEYEVSLNDFKELLIENFPTSNIFIRCFNDNETIEHSHNHDKDKFDVWMDVFYLKAKGVYDFEDVKTRVELELSDELQILPWQVMEFLQAFSKKVHSKIYVLMTDVEKVSFSFSDCSFWCIDNNKRKIVFDAEEFFDNPKNMYLDYIPF